MKIETFLQEKANIKAENKLLKVVVIVLCIITVVNYFALRKAMHNEKTILVPPVLSSKVVITGGRASVGYIKEFARYISSLAFSYTPENVRGQFKELLQLFSPDAYPSASKTFYDLADRVETARVISIFYPQKLTVDQEGNTIEVTGRRLQLSVEGDVLADENKTYVIKYKINNGTFSLEEIYEKGYKKEQKKERES